MKILMMIAAVAVVLVAAGGCQEKPAAVVAPAPEVLRWEYVQVQRQYLGLRKPGEQATVRRVTINGKAVSSALDFLNRMGALGWEMVPSLEPDDLLLRRRVGSGPQTVLGDRL